MNEQFCIFVFDTILIREKGKNEENKMRGGERFLMIFSPSLIQMHVNMNSFPYDSSNIKFQNSLASDKIDKFDSWVRAERRIKICFLLQADEMNVTRNILGWTNTV